MPRFFFDSADGKPHHDDRGLDLADLAAARVAAIRYAGQVMTSEPEVLWDSREFTVKVRNETGLLLFVIQCTAWNAPAGGETK